MPTQNLDIFHCQKCGRMVYQPHGASAPTCCRETMVCAVAGAVRNPSGDERRVRRTPAMAQVGGEDERQGHWPELTERSN